MDWDDTEELDVGEASFCHKDVVSVNLEELSGYVNEVVDDGR